MMKWFRKHNKQLLAVFASALLVVWLGGQAFQRMFQRDYSKDTLGTAMGHKITNAGSAVLRAKLDVMSSLGLQWNIPWLSMATLKQLGISDQRMAQMAMMSIGTPLDREQGRIDWWLLDLEARNMGVTVSRAQVEEHLRRIGKTAADLVNLRDSLNMATDQLLDAVAEYLRVTQAGSLASAGVQVTDPEIKDLFVKTRDQLNVRYALLPAEAFDADVAEQPIPQAELEDLFNKYRDQVPGSGPYGFGYRIPDRQVIQYAGASVQDILATLPPVPEERARKHFEQHKAEFQPPRPQTTQPTTQPDVTFEEVKDRVIERINRQEASRTLQTAIEEIRGKAWEEYAAVKPAVDTKDIPPTLAGVLEQKAQQVSKDRRIPLTYRQTDLISQEQARTEPGIGIAGGLDAKGQPVEFAQVAFNLATQADSAAKDTRNHEEKITKINPYQPVVVRSDAGRTLNSSYVFRVVRFEPAHAPATLAEVRDQVERDARTLRALKKAEEAAHRLADAARDANLKDAFNAQFPAAATQPATTQPYGDNTMKILEQPALTRAQYVPAQTVLQFAAMRQMYNVDIQGPTNIAMPARMAGVNNAQPLVEASFGLVGPATTTQPVNKVTVVELPDQKAWAVAQVVEHSPAKESDLATQRAGIAADLRLLKLRDFYADWYNPEKIRQRTNWQPTEASQF